MDKTWAIKKNSSFYYQNKYFVIDGQYQYGYYNQQPNRGSCPTCRTPRQPADAVRLQAAQPPAPCCSCCRSAAGAAPSGTSSVPALPASTHAHMFEHCLSRFPGNPSRHRIHCWLLRLCSAAVFLPHNCCRHAMAVSLSGGHQYVEAWPHCGVLLYVS